jgi:general secretion pathway protein C
MVVGKGLGWVTRYMIMRPMTPFSPSPWMSRLLTLGLAGLAAASAVGWALKVQALQTTSAVAADSVGPAAAVDTGLVAKALGASGQPVALGAPAPVLASSRLVLVGVVASGEQGAALIAVDGKPAKPFAVGAKVGDDFVLLSVQARKAVLGSVTSNTSQTDARFTLSMPDFLGKKGL